MEDMQDGEYIIESISPESGVRFEYQVYGTQFNHTLFLDRYTAPNIKLVVGEYVSAEHARLTPTSDVPTTVEKLIGKTNQIDLGEA